MDCNGITVANSYRADTDICNWMSPLKYPDTERMNDILQKLPLV